MYGTLYRSVRRLHRRRRVPRMPSSCLLYQMRGPRSRLGTWPAPREGARPHSCHATGGGGAPLRPGEAAVHFGSSLQGGSGISVYAHPARVRVARSGDGANSESTLPRIAVRSRAASGCAAGGADLTAEVPAQRPSWRRKSELYVCTASLRDTTGFAAANLREGVESGARSSAGRCRGLSPLEKRLWVRQQRFHLPGRGQHLGKRLG